MATTTTRTERSAGPAPAREAIPPLENGDHLTRPEFERRYEAMPHVKKAELIEGVVYMPSPVYDDHGQPHFLAITWLGVYVGSTPGVAGSDNGSVRLDMDNMPQPDIFIRIAAGDLGQCRLSPEKYIEGAPELIVEVASSSASYDLHEKFGAYRRNGVREYVVWRTRDGAIDWFAWREGRFERREPSDDGLYRSEVFPGLWLDPAALIRGDLKTVLQRVQDGLASPEHAEFVRRLEQARGERP